MFADKYKNKTISILGLALSAQGVMKVLKEEGLDFTLWDDKESVREEFKNKGYKIDSPAKADVVIVSPGVPFHNETIQKAVEKNIKIKTDLDIFYERNEGKGVYVGITGTAGKTTMADTLYEILIDNKIDVVRVGNVMGETVADIKGRENTIYVIEAPSFQLHYSNIQFDFSIITNIDAAHLDWHKTLEHYRNAKLSIIPKTKKQVLTLDTTVEGDRVRVFDDGVVLLKYLINELNCDVKNIENVIKLHKTKYAFEIIFQNDKFTIINDAKSTRLISLKFALNQLSGKDIHLILGGKKVENIDYTLLKSYLTSNIKSVFIYGEVAETLEKILSKSDIKYKVFDLFKDCVEDALDNVDSGVLLFSPICPSTDQFRIYSERAEKFNELVGKKYKIK